jgi:hypothetical protein
MGINQSHEIHRHDFYATQSASHMRQVVQGIIKADMIFMPWAMKHEAPNAKNIFWVDQLEFDSGCLGILCASFLGFKNIYLVGFDGGNGTFYDPHKQRRPGGIDSEEQLAYAKIKKDVGNKATIYQTNPNSLIDCFEYKELNHG